MFSTLAKFALAAVGNRQFYGYDLPRKSTDIREPVFEIIPELKTLRVKLLLSRLEFGFSKALKGLKIIDKGTQFA